MSNLLEKYYRKPGIEIKLPSDGRYYPHDIQKTISGEVAIYPMTGADEILLHNPDGLLSGSSIEAVIKSCCPAIQYPREMAAVDIDIILLAIKLVSFGPSFDIAGKCPKCEKENKFQLNIRDIMEKATPVPKEEAIRLSDELVAYVQPFTYETSTILNIKEFEEHKLMGYLLTDNMTEQEKINILSQSFVRIADYTLDILYRSVYKISTPEGDATNIEDIRNFLKEAPSTMVTKIKEAQEKINKAGMPRYEKVMCENEECKHEWELPLVYDPSTFFG